MTTKEGGMITGKARRHAESMRIRYGLDVALEQARESIWFSRTNPVVGGRGPDFWRQVVAYLEGCELLQESRAAYLDGADV